MTKTGHQIIGFSGALVLGVMGHIPEAVGFLFGSTAPDTLEMSYKKLGSEGTKAWHYGRIIKHRTLTHFWPLWVAALYLSIMVIPSYSSLHQILNYHIDLVILLNAAFLGYIAGGLGHLITDSATPMGIPLKTPYGKRFSFNLYKTGGIEWLFLTPLLISSFIFSGYEIYIRNII